MSAFFNWLINFFSPTTPQKKDSKNIPEEGKKESVPQKELILRRRQNVVEQVPDITENWSRSRLNNFSEEKKKNYKNKNYKRKKRPDSKNRKQDV